MFCVVKMIEHFLGGILRKLGIVFTENGCADTLQISSHHKGKRKNILKIK